MDTIRGWFQPATEEELKANVQSYYKAVEATRSKTNMFTKRVGADEDVAVYHPAGTTIDFQADDQYKMPTNGYAAILKERAGHASMINGRFQNHPDF